MKLFIILGNQLFHPKYLSNYKDHLFFMSEDRGLCTFEKHHKLKILLFLSSMRSYKDELKSIKFIGVEFDPDTYQRGESEINSYLDKGFTVIRDYQTASGLVMTLGKFTKRGKKE